MKVGVLLRQFKQTMLNIIKCIKHTVATLGWIASRTKMILLTQNSKKKVQFYSICSTEVSLLHMMWCDLLKIETDHVDTHVKAWTERTNNSASRQTDFPSSWCLRWWHLLSSTMLFALERLSSCWRSQSICWSFCPHLHFSCYCTNCCFNPLTAKLFNLNFHPLEVVSRWRDPQLQMSENLFRFDKMEVNCFQILLIDVTFYI